MRVTTVDFIKHYDRIAERALSEPVTITDDGRDRLVVMSVDEYERLKRSDRPAVTVGAPTDPSEDPLEDVRLDDDLIEWNR